MTQPLRSRYSVRIAPSVLSVSLPRLQEEVSALDRAGADWIHVDIMDGHFVPNITPGPDMVHALRPCTEKILDVHLMISHCELHLAAFVEAGANIVTVHTEDQKDPIRCLRAIRDLGAKAGIALSPDTPAETIRNLLDYIDLVLVMTVNPGLGGQSFLSGQLSKIAEIRQMIEKRAIRLEVDGGITLENAGAVYDAGADVLVAGTAVLKGGTPDAYTRNIANLRKAATPGV